MICIAKRGEGGQIMLLDRTPFFIILGMIHGSTKEYFYPSLPFLDELIGKSIFLDKGKSQK